MNNMIEHAIGSNITLPDGRKVDVVEDNKPSILLNCACWACAFGKEGNRKYCTDIAGECSGKTRTDRTDIIYKEVK